MLNLQNLTLNQMMPSDFSDLLVKLDVNNPLAELEIKHKLNGYDIGSYIDGYFHLRKILSAGFKSAHELTARLTSELLDRGIDPTAIDFKAVVNGKKITIPPDVDDATKERLMEEQRLAIPAPGTEAMIIYNENPVVWVIVKNGIMSIGGDKNCLMIPKRN